MEEGDGVNASRSAVMCGMAESGAGDGAATVWTRGDDFSTLASVDVSRGKSVRCSGGACGR